MPKGDLRFAVEADVTDAERLRAAATQSERDARFARIAAEHSGVDEKRRAFFKERERDAIVSGCAQALVADMLDRTNELWIATCSAIAARSGNMSDTAADAALGAIVKFGGFE